MPTTSQAQHNFFQLCKHNPSKAKRKCPPKKVVREFLAADKRRK